MFHRDSDKRELTAREQRIYDFMSRNHTAVLATVDPNNNPYAAVIYYTIAKNFEVSFVTKKKTRKYSNLIRNNHVILVVYEATSQTVTQIIGTAIEMSENYKVNRIASDIFTGNVMSGERVLIPPISKLDAGEHTAFRIDPKQIRMASYTQPSVGDYKPIFESIESFELNT